jgi:hypothetical protein
MLTAARKATQLTYHFSFVRSPVLQKNFVIDLLASLQSLTPAIGSEAERPDGVLCSTRSFRSSSLCARCFDPRCGKSFVLRVAQ